MRSSRGRCSSPFPNPFRKATPDCVWMSDNTEQHTHIRVWYSWCNADLTLPPPFYVRLEFDYSCLQYPAVWCSRTANMVDSVVQYVHALYSLSNHCLALPSKLNRKHVTKLGDALIKTIPSFSRFCTIQTLWSTYSVVLVSRGEISFNCLILYRRNNYQSVIKTNTK